MHGQPDGKRCLGLEVNAQHDSIWGLCTPDWSTNALRHGAATAAEALAVTQPYPDNTRVGLRDQWNWAALTATNTTAPGLAGLPWCSSHCWWHLSAWHLLPALAGQQYSAVTGLLELAPTLPTLPTPLTLPVFVPGAVAKFTDSGSRSGGARGQVLEVVLGKLVLSAVVMPAGNWSAPGNGKPVTLVAGQRIAW